MFELSQKEIMDNWGDNRVPLVSVGCITYNHEEFVEETIQSFLMQKTSFPFEVIIHDDASTDATAKIIKRYAEKYPNIIKPIFQKENQYSKIHRPIYPTFVYPMCKGEYIALCEGDDYWTHPYKLQKQVAIMEEHPECSLSFHAYKHLGENDRTNKISRAHHQSTIFPKNKIIKIATRSSHTSTLVFRSQYVKNLPEWFIKAPTGDIPLKLLLLNKGSAIYINDIMSAYREQTPSSYSRIVRNNVDRFISVKKRRSIMWQEFNRYSNYKYNDDIVEQIMISEMQIPFDKNFYSRLIFFNKKIQKLMTGEVPLKRKFMIFLIALALLIDPNLRQRNIFYNNVFSKLFYRV